MQVFHPEWKYDNHITAILEDKSMKGHTCHVRTVTFMAVTACPQSVITYVLFKIQLTKSESSLSVEVLMPLLVPIVK